MELLTLEQIWKQYKAKKTLVINKEPDSKLYGVVAKILYFFVDGEKGPHWSVRINGRRKDIKDTKSWLLFSDNEDYVAINDSIWPTQELASELESKLRYGIDLTGEERLKTADVLSAYLNLINKPKKTKDTICKELQKK
jgi:hypothetical protein